MCGFAGCARRSACYCLLFCWLFSELEGLSSLTFVIGLEGLSPIGVWDVLGGGAHDGQGACEFPSATLGEESLVW